MLETFNCWHNQIYGIVDCSSYLSIFFVCVYNLCTEEEKTIGLKFKCTCVLKIVFKYYNHSLQVYIYIYICIYMYIYIRHLNS